MDKFKKILSVVTLVLIAFIAYKAFTGPVSTPVKCVEGKNDGIYAACETSEETDADGDKVISPTTGELTWQSMKEINVLVLLLLIPEQIFMYYSAGQIYFAFLRQRKNFKISTPKLTRISLEINFVNHAIPSGGMSGLAYLVWRLKDMHITAGQISFIHVLRYAICAIANTIQTFIAIVIVLIAGCVREGQYWVLWLAGLIALGIQAVIFIAWMIVRKQKRVDWLSDNAARLINRIVRKFTHGKKRKFLKEESVAKFFGDLRNYYLRIARNKKTLILPAIWGGIYSFLELATYWVVGCALGHPEILPQIMIAEGVASVVGTVMVTPGGVGGYEGAMIAILFATGVSLDVATITVTVTRVFVLLGTIISGYPLYQLSLMSRKDKFVAPKEGEEIAA